MQLEMLRQPIAMIDSEHHSSPIERLVLILSAAGLKPKQALPLIAPLLNLPVPKNYPPVPAASEEQRR